jgi:uncharacterized protein (UPF0261 family)
MARRRLRKAEEAVVDPAVAAAMEMARPHILALERLIVDQLVPAVGPVLAPAAGLRFLDAVGNELWMSAELAALLAGSEDSAG